MLLAILFILLGVTVVIGCLYLLFIAAIYIVAFIVTGIQLATGKLTREQLAENAAKYNEQKKQKAEQKRLRKLWHNLTYCPPPLFLKSWGRSSCSRTIYFDVDIDVKKED